MALYQRDVSRPDFQLPRYVGCEELPWSSALNRADVVKKFAVFFDDRNPVHRENDFAKAARYRSVIASGAHTLALFNSMIDLESSFNYLLPVKARDRLLMSWEMMALARKRSRQSMLVDLKGKKTVNQNVGEV